MRRSLAVTAGMALAMLACASAAQNLDVPLAPLLAPLHYGQLTVWVVRTAGTLKPKALAVTGLNQQTPLTYQEQTAGSFGQNAGSYGADSSSTGVATGSPTLDAPPAGSGYHEQTAGSFGQPSSEVGTVASNHGQTASSYGRSLSTIAATGPLPVRNPDADSFVFVDRLRRAVALKSVDVDADELNDRLAAAEGTRDYPDILVGSLPAVWLAKWQNEFLVTLLPVEFLPDGVTPRPSDYLRRQPPFAILLRAPHREAARALAIWISEWPSCPGCVLRRDQTAPDVLTAVDAATAAVERLARAQGIGELADPAMAEFPPHFGLAMVPSVANDGTPGAAGDASVRVEAVEARILGRMAAVSVRVVTVSDGVFGVAHPLVVLRKGDDGRWRVLHLSLNLPAYEQGSELNTLTRLRPANSAELRALPKGIAQAAPADGDVRPATPDLWWDNLGGAVLQVVEWQRALVPDAWSDAHLLLVHDRNFHLKTQVNAEFAAQAATYRWRVWSVGSQGEMKISPWRTLRVISR